MHERYYSHRPEREKRAMREEAKNQQTIFIDRSKKYNWKYAIEGARESAVTRFDRNLPLRVCSLSHITTLSRRPCPPPRRYC